MTKAWSVRRQYENYERIVASWRAQSATAVAVELGIQRHAADALQQNGQLEPMMREPVASSNIVSIGYDDGSETLEIEFSNGTVYQYYNVEGALKERFWEAPSKGQFLNTYIRNSHPYSKVG